MLSVGTSAAKTFNLVKIFYTKIYNVIGEIFHFSFYNIFNYREEKNHLIVNAKNKKFKNTPHIVESHDEAARTIGANYRNKFNFKYRKL